jgi:hypothetical protein
MLRTQETMAPKTKSHQRRSKYVDARDELLSLASRPVSPPSRRLSSHCGDNGGRKACEDGRHRDGLNSGDRDARHLQLSPSAPLLQASLVQVNRVSFSQLIAKERNAQRARGVEEDLATQAAKQTVSCEINLI